MPAQVRALYDRLRSYRHLGLRVAAIYLLRPDERAEPSYEKRLLRNPQEILELVRSGQVDQVFAALPLEQAAQLREIQEWLGDEPVALHFVPDLAELATLRGNIEEFDGLQLISLQSSPLDGWNALIKRTVDLALSMIALIIFLPLMVDDRRGDQVLVAGASFVPSDTHGTGSPAIRADQISHHGRQC